MCMQMECAHHFCIFKVRLEKFKLLWNQRIKERVQFLKNRFFFKTNKDFF
jgi:hypothetical protein